MRRLPNKNAGGFSIIEAAACVLVIVLLALLTQLWMAHSREKARPQADADQLRTIDQAMTTWTNSNQDNYPIPSKMDSSDSTIVLKDGESARSKDTFANALSILIFQGAISPQLCVSPAEVNPNIQSCDRYEYDDPSAAAMPCMALWDPAFSVDFTDPNTPGNDSYATLELSNARLRYWRNTFNAMEPILANRGPHVVGVDRAAGGDVTGVQVSPGASNTYRIHGSSDTWEGNVAYNDGHVNFETSLVQPGRSRDEMLTYVSSVFGRRTPDVFFCDEPDDVDGKNFYLGIFTTAGEKPEDFHAIWD